MNTQLKVGDKVKIISGANMPEHNNQCGVIQQIGEPTMPLFTDYMAIKLDSGIVALCYTYEDDNRVVNIELLEPAKHTPKWLLIDKDNLPVLAGNIDKKQIVVNRITINHLDGTIQSHNRREFFEVTHYISLTDLLNLPLAE